MQHTLQTSQKADLSNYKGNFVMKMMTKLVPSNSNTECSLPFLAISCGKNIAKWDVFGSKYTPGLFGQVQTSLSSLGGRVLTLRLID